MSENQPADGGAAAQSVEKPRTPVEPGDAGTAPASGGQPVRLHEGRQGKHVEGSNNHIPSRSTLTANPRELLQQFAGQGQQMGRIPVGQAGSKEVFDAGRIIGTYRTQAGLSAPTTRGMIHYSNDGAHIVPAAPRNWQP